MPPWCNGRKYGFDKGGLNMSMVHYKCSGCGREVAYQYWDIILDEARSDFRPEECYGGKKNGKHYCKDCFEGKTKFSINLLNCGTPYLLSFKGKEYKLDVGGSSQSEDGSKVSSASSSARELKNDLGVKEPFWFVCFNSENPGIVEIGDKKYKFEGEVLQRDDARCKITVLEEAGEEG